jgi:hypothetical protein
VDRDGQRVRLYPDVQFSIVLHAANLWQPIAEVTINFSVVESKERATAVVRSQSTENSSPTASVPHRKLQAFSYSAVAWSNEAAGDALRNLKAN